MDSHKHTGDHAKHIKHHKMGSAPKDHMAHESHHEHNKMHGTPNGFRTAEGQQCGPDTSAGGMPCNEYHENKGKNMPESHAEDASPSEDADD